jgi:hypothetical protein
MVSTKKIAAGLTSVTILVGVVAPTVEHGKTHEAQHTSATFFGTILTSTEAFVPLVPPARVQYAHPIEILRDSVSENAPVAPATFYLA